MKVSDLGELGLIERITAGLGPVVAGSGDDAAVVQSPGDSLLFTTDVMVESVDFDRAYCSGADVGWKAIAINASDIAAMGGEPSHAVVGLSLPSDTRVDFVDDMVVGMAAAARRWSLTVAGGDISSAREIAVAVAMIGAPVTERPVYRSGAHPGDAICVTGSLGGAAGGLAVLRKGLDVTEPGLEELARRHLRPVARVAEAARLAGVPVSAMIDVSDGLAIDLWHLMDASQTGCEVDPSSIPVDPALAAAAGTLGLDPLRTAMLGGEDFELLFTLEDGQVGAVRALLADVGTDVTVIGAVTSAERLIGDVELEELKEAGWDHLRTR
ncbi:MAG: thiamine-phosphate kinase [Actinomycetota bacterium]